MKKTMNENEEDKEGGREEERKEREKNEDDGDVMVTRDGLRRDSNPNQRPNQESTTRDREQGKRRGRARKERQEGKEGRLQNKIHDITSYIYTKQGIFLCGMIHQYIDYGVVPLYDTNKIHQGNGKHKPA